MAPLDNREDCRGRRASSPIHTKRQRVQILPTPAEGGGVGLRPPFQRLKNREIQQEKTMTKTYSIETQWLENYGETTWKSKGGETYKVTVPDGRYAQNHAVALAAQEFIINELGVEYVISIEERDTGWMPSDDEPDEEYGNHKDRWLKIITADRKEVN